MAADVFRSRVPEWLIRLTIVLVMLPTVMLFALSVANVNAAAGYYGAEPADVQFSMLLFYAAVACFPPLERRFFSRIATKEYFLLCLVLQVLVTWCCYETREIPVLFIGRFLQGMINCGVTSICLTLLFGRLRSEYSRETGYAIFYGMILCSAPLTSLLSAPLVDNFEYPVLYKAIIFTFMPGAVLLLLLMRNVRLSPKTPLYQLDGSSFILYAALLVGIGYVLVYGQQYYWLEDPRISGVLMAILLLAMGYGIRQYRRKRPFMHLGIFRSKGFLLGALLLAILYIIRGSLNITTAYFANVLGMDPYNLYELLLFNIGGIVAGIFCSSAMVKRKRPMQLIWMIGFGLMGVFHVWMYFLFSAQADAMTFVWPLVLQGVGAGMLMTPIILFMVSAVPEHMSQSAASAGVFIRFACFSASIALINYGQLFFSRTHAMRLSDHLSGVDEGVQERLYVYRAALQYRGMGSDQAAKAAQGLLDRATQQQAFLHFAMDYYEMITLLIIAVMCLIVTAPFINRILINVRSKQPAAATF
ncbi:MFS transporter [Chitinophaga pendula]|uniref:MFS transporter n=1 Tax=Chitinophaga TaxID=79328 RepID=UPI000BB0C7A0|nr:MULTISPECIES: MFS transporter [Chitinophaga]ASZ12997.1 transporter [Chitinophaga sp. MD30]UCJ09372.1 MFS transporter [Chitinophaga pendula]